jgi:hypothetical protein
MWRRLLQRKMAGELEKSGLGALLDVAGATVFFLSPHSAF